MVCAESWLRVNVSIWSRGGLRIRVDGGGGGSGHQCAPFELGRSRQIRVYVTKEGYTLRRVLKSDTLDVEVLNWGRESA